MDKDHEVEEPLLPVGASPVKRRAPWHQRHRKALLVLGGVSAVLLVALVIVQTQIHRIATNAIAATEMSIQRMELTQPLAHSLTLSLALLIQSPSFFTAELAATNFTIRYQEGVVGVFAAPSMTVKQGRNLQQFANTSLEIANRTTWDAFARDLMQNPALTYEINGQLALRVKILGGLIHLSASDIALVKTMSSDGMNGLKQMEIADIQMTNSTQKQVIATIKTCLYNPSVIVLRPVGRICMNAHYPRIGSASHVASLLTNGVADIAVDRNSASHPYCASRSTDKKDMRSGYNLLELTGEMLSTNPEAISALISKYLSNTPADLEVVPCHPQATTVDIFNIAMQDLKIPTILPPRVEPLVGKMFFQSIRLDAPRKEDENDVLGLSTGVTVEASSPLGPNSALMLKEIHMTVGLYAVHEQHELFLGNLTTLKVDITNGKLVETSNISVDCVAQLKFDSHGKPFGSFVRESVVQNEVKLHLKGSMNVIAKGALGHLSLTGLPLDVATQLQGMDNLQRVTIDEFELPGKAVKPRGEALSTKISIWNPSLFSVSIGVVTMQLNLAEGSSSDRYLGELTGNMVLHPGKNKLHMKGELKPHLDAQGRVSDGVAQFFSKYLRGDESRVSVIIQGVQYPDCTWMNDALVGLVITTPFPGVAPGFQLISNLQMRELDVSLAPRPANIGSPASNTVMKVRTDLTATVKMPDTISIPISIANVSVNLRLEDEGMSVMGALTSDREVCEFDQAKDGYFRLDMHKFYPISFNHPSEAGAMASFVKYLLTQSGNVTLRLVSHADADEGAFPYVNTRMGMLPLLDIPIIGAPQLPAMNSFRDPPIKILKVDILGGSDSAMYLMMEFEIRNPSVVKTALGALSLEVFSSQAKMGTATIADFKLECCGKATVLKGTFLFQPAPTDRLASSKFLSNFVCGYFTNGTAQEISIAGTKESTPLDLLQPALAALEMPTQLPTLADLFPSTPTLVTSSLLYTPSIIHLDRIPTSLMLQNPFSENITVIGVDLLLYPCEVQAKVNDTLVCHSYYSVPLARFAPEKFDPIFIPANSDGCHSCCQGANCEKKTAPLCPNASIGQCMTANVQGLISAEAIAAIFHTATTGLLMKVNGTIEAAIGAYNSELFYRQEGLLVTMAKIW
ncbi:hypothetical protein Poli38472_010286 [Pythium oligandrum]|uniref:Uncharacterized protein n=1 Tax=Pythium oligandrum TaxID=41045 RepID=A0A8K1FGI1_PYTOL|nr:hypothetical protein Poli38472_010286 [Pythium oligandrum]|eukprot:TMW58727.1 hypothetical protein Poli38472_010286 [Pythium oligandrum]